MFIAIKAVISTLNVLAMIMALTATKEAEESTKKVVLLFELLWLSNMILMWI